MSDQRLISQLEGQFPWLKIADTENGEYEQVSGADVVQSLTDWYSTLVDESLDAPEGEREIPASWDFIAVARRLHEVEGEVEIEDPGCISLSDDGGAYVMAFVFVPGDNFCRTCYKPYEGGGDGFDGECPSCADKAEEKVTTLDMPASPALDKILRNTELDWDQDGDTITIRGLNDVDATKADLERMLKEEHAGTD